MRITFFVPKCTPDNSHGRYVIELAKRFHNEHSITIYSGGFWPPLRGAVRCHVVPVPIRPAVARLVTLWAASLLIGKRSSEDIVHIQGADAPVGNVVTAHCCNAAMRSAVHRSERLHRRMNFIVGMVVEKYCMSKSGTHRIIAVSRKVAAEIEREYGIDPRRITVVHNGVDSAEFHPNHRLHLRGPARDLLGLGPDAFVVLFVGGEYRRKGLIPLVEAARKVSAVVRIVAVGAKPDARLARFARENDRLDLVTFLEHTADVVSLYAAADCFALPSQYDTFSLATLEAMASGLPVIVSRSAGVAEILTSGRDSLVLEDPFDVDRLAQSIDRMATNAEFRLALGAEARKTAEHHSWDKVADRTLEVYREALANG